MDAAAAIPDGIAPISAYRAWRYVLEGRDASLHALSCIGFEHCRWAPRGWVTARCDRGGGHIAPQEGCSCGFYGMKELDLLSHELLTCEEVVVGRVEFAGCVIEHEFGYRAARARIAELMAVEGHIRHVMLIANLLGIRMAPLLPRAGGVQDLS